MTAAFALVFAPAAPSLELAFARSPSATAEFSAAYVGPSGAAGGAAFIRQSDGPISALRIVWEDEFGVVRPLDAGDEDHIDLASGLTLTAAAGAGPVTVQRFGPVDDAAWAWTPGLVYLGADGALTQTPPVDGFDLLVGTAVSATRLILDFQDPIELE